MENLLADFEEFSQEEFRKFREEGVKEEFRQLRDESMKVEPLVIKEKDVTTSFTRTSRASAGVTSSLESQEFKLWKEWEEVPDHVLGVPTHFRRHSTRPSLGGSVDNMPLIRTYYLLHPSGFIKFTWDLCGVLVLLYDLITLPLAVFNPPVTTLSNTMFWIILIYWTLDIPLTFVTGYYDSNGNLELHPGRVAMRYVKRTFALDVAIILNDWIPVTLSSSGLSAFRMLRILRMARFLRLLRIRKLKDLIQSIEDHIESDYFQVILSICGDCMVIVTINHFIACMWFYISSKLKVPGYGSWVEVHNFDKEPWDYQYVTSLHWAITQFTPGSMTVQPQNIIERAYAIMVLLFALVAFSAFVSNLTQARLELQKITSKLGKEWYQLRKFIRQNNIPRELGVRVERYITRSVIPQLNRVETKDVVLLMRLSDPLRKALFTSVHSTTIICHPLFSWLNRCGKVGMQEVCYVLTQTSLAEGDTLFRPGQLAHNMYFPLEGVIQYVPVYRNSDTRCLTPGTWCCEAVLWMRWVFRGKCDADKFANLLLLDSGKFREVIAKDSHCFLVARHYAVQFVEQLNAASSQRMKIHDLHEDLLDSNALVEAAVDAVERCSDEVEENTSPIPTNKDE